MKNRLIVSLFMSALLLALSIGIASAIAPVADVTVTSGGVDDGPLLGVSSGVPQGQSSCEVVATTYLQFDVPASTTEGGLFLYVENAAYSQSFDLVAYQVDDDTWNETSVVGDFPAPGAPLYTANIDPTTNPLPINQTIELSSSAMDTFVASQAAGTGDGTASFAIRVINCSDASVSIDFVATEGASSTMPAPELTAPTAVEMTSVSAINESSFHPILLGGVALLALSAGILTVGILRRKGTTA